MVQNISVLCLSVFISSLAHVALKLGIIGVNAKYGGMSEWKNFINCWLAVGIVGHLLALLLWIYCLSRVDISFAYPFLSLGYVFIAFMSYFWLQEAINASRIVGMLLIMCGIAFVARS